MTWNAPKSFVNLDSPGVVALATSVVPDVLGLGAFHDDGALVRVLPGMTENIIQILVLDDRAEPRGFHDILLEDMTTENVPAALAGDMSDLRKLRPQSWSRSVVSVSASLAACDQAYVLIVGWRLCTSPLSSGIIHV